MTSLVCALTGCTPEDPVFSKTGYIFERRSIEKFLKASGDGVCPISGEPLTIDDLQPIKGSELLLVCDRIEQLENWTLCLSSAVSKTVKPRPATATSIPGLLALLQNEWDSLMAETFSLRTHLDTVRQQLSHSLYQHDAACRVIARLIKERDGLRHQLSGLQDQVATSAISDVPLSTMGPRATAPEVVDIGLSAELMEEWRVHAKTLLSQRKKRTLEGLAAVEKVKSWVSSGSYSIHSSTTPGVSCCVTEAKDAADSRKVWTGGVDGLVALFDIDQQKTTGRLVGHLKKVNQVISHPAENIVVSASDDKTVRVWVSHDGSPSEYRTSWILRRHRKAVTSISLHPSGSHFLSGSKDLTWAIHDLRSGQTCKTFAELPCEFTCLSFHPDGMLIGAAGVNGKICIYDIKTFTDLVALGGHTAAVLDLQFSENGYYLASCSADGTARLWDLRKSTNFETIEPLAESNGAVMAPTRVNFDHSGNYLAVAGLAKGAKSGAVLGGHLSVYYFESRATVRRAVTLDGHVDTVTDATFGHNAEYMISASMDRTIRLWEPPPCPPTDATG